MYTTEIEDHREQAMSYNEKTDQEKPLFMTAQGFICFKPYLAEPKPKKDGTPGNYEIGFATPANCPVIKDIIAKVKEFKRANFKNQRGIKMPFKLGTDYLNKLLEDTTKEEAEEIEERYGKMRDHVYFNLKTKFFLNEDPEKPQLIDHNKAALDPEKVFGGAIGRVILAPYAYVNPENKGISLGLRCFQQLKKSDFSSNWQNAAQAFGSATNQDPVESAADAFSGTGSTPETTEIGSELDDIGLFDD